MGTPRADLWRNEGYRQEQRDGTRGGVVLFEAGLPSVLV